MKATVIIVIGLIALLVLTGCVLPDLTPDDSSDEENPNYEPPSDDIPVPDTPADSESDQPPQLPF